METRDRKAAYKFLEFYKKFGNIQQFGQILYEKFYCKSKNLFHSFKCNYQLENIFFWRLKMLIFSDFLQNYYAKCIKRLNKVLLYLELRFESLEFVSESLSYQPKKIVIEMVVQTINKYLKIQNQQTANRDKFFKCIIRLNHFNNYSNFLIVDKKNKLYGFLSKKTNLFENNKHNTDSDYFNKNAFLSVYKKYLVVQNNINECFINKNLSLNKLLNLFFHANNSEILNFIFITENEIEDESISRMIPFLVARSNYYGIYNR